MLGFLGFPVTGGFIGKFYVFASASQHGWWWLIVIGVDRHDHLGGVLPRRHPGDVPARSAELQLAPAGGSPPRDPSLVGAVGLCLAVSVGSLIFVQPLIDVARSAADALPF